MDKKKLVARPVIRTSKNNAPTLVQDLFTPREAAERLRISRSHVYSLMDRGLVSYVKIGRCRRISAKEIARIVDEGVET